MPEIFISYREKDAKGWVILLAQTLKKKFGTDEVVFDKDFLKAGEWSTQLEKAITECKVFIIVIGPGWASITNENGQKRLDDPNDFHRREIELAVSRSNILILPIFVGGASPSILRTLPAELSRLASFEGRLLSDKSAYRKLDLLEIIKDIQRGGVKLKSGRFSLKFLRYLLESAKSVLKMTVSIIIILALIVVSLLFSFGNKKDKETTEKLSFSDDLRETIKPTKEKIILQNFLMVLVKPLHAAELPRGYSFLITLKGQGKELHKEISNEAKSVKFENLFLGKYTLIARVMSYGSEIGSTRKDVNLFDGENSLEIEIPIKQTTFNGSFSVVDDFSILNGKYDGVMKISGCYKYSFNPASSDVSMTVLNREILIKADVFPDLNFELKGQLNKLESKLSANGSFSSSYNDFSQGVIFKKGKWTTDKFITPNVDSIYFDINLVDDNSTKCGIIATFTGIK